MESWNSINLDLRVRELEESFSGVYRRVWFSRTRLGSVCITVFGQNLYNDCERKVFPDPGYRIYFAFKVEDYSLENLRNIVLSQIES